MARLVVGTATASCDTRHELLLGYQPGSVCVHMDLGALWREWRKGGSQEEFLTVFFDVSFSLKGLEQGGQPIFLVHMI